METFRQFPLVWLELVSLSSLLIPSLPLDPHRGLSLTTFPLYEIPDFLSDADVVERKIAEDGVFVELVVLMVGMIPTIGLNSAVDDADEILL